MQLRPPLPTPTSNRDDQNDRIGWPPRLTSDGKQLPTLVVAVLFRPVPDAIVSLAMRLMWNDKCIAEKPVWFAQFATVGEAAVRYDWLVEHSQELEYWACHAELESSDALLELIEEGVRLQQQELQQDEHAAEEVVNRAAQPSIVIQSRWFELNGKFGVALHKGDDAPPFWTILFRENWERERFQDWWIHQQRRLTEVGEFLETNTAADLERCLLREMLTTERAVKNAGLGSGGRRPLRFWRGDGS